MTIPLSGSKKSNLKIPADYADDGCSVVFSGIKKIRTACIVTIPVFLPAACRLLCLLNRIKQFMSASLNNVQFLSVLSHIKVNFRQYYNSFSQNLPAKDKHLDIIIKLLICAAMAGIIAADIMYLEHLGEVREELMEISYGQAFMIFALAFLFISILELLWRSYLVWKYRPMSPCPQNELLSCSIVVPAFNEGRQVYMTLKSLAASNYPSEKFQIIAVDDGSSDDTWDWICKAKQELGRKVTALKLPCNKGKRHALYAGFQQSRGEVLVTVDSDSEVKPETLQNLISPMVINSRIGAVAGNIRVLNHDKGIIPRMLDVLFVFSFDFIRASQSMVNMVMCTPGALAAYRKTAVMPILQEWLNQTFFGRPSNIGEDRAITNLVIREGYDVFYQQNAVAYTNVPTGYTGLCKMFLRWARSHIRETIVMSRFAFRKFRFDSVFGLRVNLILHWFGIVLSPFFLFATIACLYWRPLGFGLCVMVGIILTSTVTGIVYTKRCGNSDALLSYLYGLFVFISLSWISTYSLATMHHSGWLTRNNTVKKQTSATILHKFYFDFDAFDSGKDFQMHRSSRQISETGKIAA
ncbi:MAG: hyaluronan synthase [Thermodesulfobacteriota bacterium]|nr:hyaluronan synthase [Thermodesulfobacteriota bacterium]